MATLINRTDVARRERKFFFVMACVMAATIMAGFSFNLAVGRSSFGLPLLFHIHAFVFFGWVALYVVQNALVATNNVDVHRRLGWLALGFLPAMVVLGLAMTLASARRGAPFFFDVNEFLFGNSLQLLAFAAVVLAAISLRRRTDWHRRLMYCGMATLTGPGLGRLLPQPLFMPWAWWVVIFATFTFPLIGMIADKRRAGRIHPAWYWGLAASFGALLVGDLLAYSPLGYSVTASVVEGTPGAQRPITAYMP